MRMVLLHEFVSGRIHLSDQLRSIGQFVNICFKLNIGCKELISIYITIS